ncbi:MAG: UDP-glucose/GDP-mannose dehydrogenase family protein, partial [Planctomycetes bacterium]|nr:UDP-glucose/GDP-mannose dehydrogenase family protein [Planctomycetota bacterium]
MKLAVVGTGYVGLVAGTCFADSGNEVTCVDIDAEKITRLRGGELPIYEPGLGELIDRNMAVGRLSFTTQLAEAVKDSRLIFVAVGTPQADDGAADLSNLWALVHELAACMAPAQSVVIKSTVPVGTNAAVAQRLSSLLHGARIDVASNPEFLKEGAAIEDFTRPDRVVVGVRRAEVAEVLRHVYAPFLRAEQP